MIPILAAAQAISTIGKLSEGAASVLKHAAPAGASAQQGAAGSFAAHLAAAVAKGS